MSCKGICRLKYKTIAIFGTATKAKGMLTCTQCLCRIKFRGIFCPCCGQRLRWRTILKSKKRELEVEAKRY